MHLCIFVSFSFARTMISYIEKKRSLPGTWFIQLDNTVKYVFVVFLFCSAILCRDSYNLLNHIKIFSSLSQGKQKQICPCVSEISCWLWYVWAHLPQFFTCGTHPLWYRSVVQQNCCLDERYYCTSFVLLLVSLVLYKCILYFHLLLLVLANEAYTWDELAAAIRKAYKEITEVYVLPKLINFTEFIHPYLNDPSKTPGWH